MMHNFISFSIILTDAELYLVGSFLKPSAAYWTIVIAVSQRITRSLKWTSLELEKTQVLAKPAYDPYTF
jgi:hypothetical protein